MTGGGGVKNHQKKRDILYGRPPRSSNCPHNHMYADDTQLIAHLTINDIPSVATRLQNWIEAIQVWYNSRRLQLNPTKTELIWFGSKTNLKKIADLDLNLYIGLDIIKPVNVVRDLGVYLDSELFMEHHISTVVRACFFHLRPPPQIHPSNPRCRCHVGSGVGFCDNQN